MSPIAVSMSASSRTTSVPSSANSSCTRASRIGCPLDWSAARMTAPWRTSTGVLGSTRYTGRFGYAALTSASGVAARIDTTALACGPTSSATDSSCAGLWHSTTRSARCASSAFDATASPPTSAASACARGKSTSAHRTGWRQPSARPRAMAPAPMRPIFTAMETSRVGSGLVEEALLDELRALLRGDLDVARREHEHLVGDALHAAVQRVRQPAREIDQALAEVGLDALEVEHDRDRVLELVGDLLGVVEALGDDEVHAHVAASVPAAHRAQDGGRAPAAVVVVGEDVVEVVAPALRAEPPDVGPLAVAVLELGLGLVGGLLLLVRVALLGEAEVDERTVPRVAEGHYGTQVSPLRAISCNFRGSITGTASCRGARSSPPPRPRRRSPATSPCSGAAARARPRARPARRTSDGCPRPSPRAAASS